MNAGQLAVGHFTKGCFVIMGGCVPSYISRKHSTLSAVVLKWSRARKRYERQGLLVEERALEQAEQECLADSEARARLRERNVERRAELDEQYVKNFAGRIRELFYSANLEAGYYKKVEIITPMEVIRDEG